MPSEEWERQVAEAELGRVREQRDQALRDLAEAQVVVWQLTTS